MWLWQKDTPDQTNVLLLPRVKSSPSEIQVINIIILDLTKIKNVHLSFYVGKKATLPFCFSGPSLRSRLGDIHLNLSETIALSVVGWRWRLAPEAQAGQTVEVQTAVVDYKDQNWSCVTSPRAALGSEEAVHPTQPSRQITELLARRKKWATVQILLQNTSCRLLQSQPHSSRLWNVTTWEH